MKMFDNSNTRIFLQGNEDVARWHLPVVLSKFKAFVQRCKEAGLKQDRFTMFFEDTGTSVFGQYFYGEESVQLYSPLRSVVLQEKSKSDLSAEVGPKTFFINTVQGYFWVEVRYAESGTISVILTPFVATVTAGDGATESFIYPGFALNAPGMIAGCTDGSEDTRFVLSQNGGVMSGAGEKKGTINSTSIIDPRSRITVVENSGGDSTFLLMKTDKGQAMDVRRVSVSFDASAISVMLDYASINMAYEGEVNLSVETMNTLPAWIHQKCSGSYFSPNKTIGYHVSIGVDDGFMGNILSVYGGDLLDNTGGFEESMFNHTQDLYRILGMCAFPVSISGDTIQMILASPTMGFSDDPLNSKKCWGGYGLTQSWASCVDYQADGNAWLLAPQPILLDVNLVSGEKVFYALADGMAAYRMNSWDATFSATVNLFTERDCGTVFSADTEKTQISDQCAWSTACKWTCDTNDPGSTGQCPTGWTPYSTWVYFSREDLRNSLHVAFLPGSNTVSPSSPDINHTYFFMFDGLWHLDIGVIWGTSRMVGNNCGLCIYPYGSQAPGSLVTFAVQGSSVDWLREHGTEYVKNMNLVTPLGYVDWPLGGTVFGFVAMVPEEYETPHEPVLMTGGLRYPSPTVEGEEVMCERSLMSSVCICADNIMVLGEESVFELGTTGQVIISNGCPPFEIYLVGAEFTDGDTYKLTANRAHSINAEQCYAKLYIKDACGTEIVVEETYPTDTYTVAGANVMYPGDTSVFYHDMGYAAEYTGTLELIGYVNGAGGIGASLKMPDAATTGDNYTVVFEGLCADIAMKNVKAGNPECLYDYEAPLMNIPPTDASILCGDGKVWQRSNDYIGPIWYTSAACATFTWVFVCGANSVMEHFHGIPNPGCFSYKSNKRLICTLY